jgi:hypothetical protein
MKFLNFLKITGTAILCVFGMIGSAISAEKKLIPQRAFFGGLGGGWSSGSFGNQEVYGKGTSYSPPHNAHTAQVGSAAGSTSLELSSQSALAPVVQVGYFMHFSDRE